MTKYLLFGFFVLSFGFCVGCSEPSATNEVPEVTAEDEAAMDEDMEASMEAGAAMAGDSGDPSGASN